MKPKRHCPQCGTPERISTALGVPLTNLAPYSGLCWKCLKLLAAEKPKRKPKRKLAYL